MTPVNSFDELIAGIVQFDHDLRHMLAAIEKIDRYLTGIDYQAFAANDMMIDAVVRELEIILPQLKSFVLNQLARGE